MIDISKFTSAIESAPGISPLLEKCARRAMRGACQPATMSLSGISYDEERELSTFFRGNLRRTSSGRIVVEVPDELREPAAWAGIAAHLGFVRQEQPDVASVFKRAELMYGKTPLVADAVNVPEIVRFVKQPENARQWLTLFGCVLSRWPRVTKTTTLSQLGSDLFGNSKILRGGALRRQLFLLLQLVDATGIEDERTLLTRFGIIDNPFTTHVTAFAPFEYTLDDGTTFDYPARLFEKGMACQLPLETIERISRITMKRALPAITTSENAAPFAQMVEERKPSVYTEGYPNTAVKGLLGHFSNASVEAIHEGDADLDGFNIAEDVGHHIRVRRTVAEDVLSNATDNGGIPLTDAQIARLDAYLNKRGQSVYKSSYIRLKQLGRWFEQESFHEA